MRDFIVKLVDCCSFLHWLWHHLTFIISDSENTVAALVHYEQVFFYKLLSRKIDRSVTSWKMYSKFLCQLEDAKVSLYQDGTTNVTDLFDKVDIFEAEKYAYCILAAAGIQRDLIEEGV